jgi:hypothetical protein
MEIKKKIEAGPLEQIEKINEKGFKVYLGVSSLDTIIFSPKGEELGCILALEIIRDCNNKDLLQKVKLTGLLKLITEQEKDELIELNKINKKEMNG